MRNIWMARMFESVLADKPTDEFRSHRARKDLWRYEIDPEREQVLLCPAL
ncbi:hypothetical protein ACFL4C_01815 [Candidatus Omnitrophota bacterium]